MDRREREQQDRKMIAHRDDWLTMLAGEGLRAPDELGTTWAKWLDGTTMVIVRFGLNGTATLDASWLEDDGHRNGPFAPRDAPYVPWLARDITRTLATPGREVLATWSHA